MSYETEVAVCSEINKKRINPLNPEVIPSAICWHYYITIFSALAG
jgi:hypothetical protein